MNSNCVLLSINQLWITLKLCYNPAMLRIYNSLTREIEDFKPLDSEGKRVTMYTCGPTVYSFAHIGNFRTYTTSDLLKRTLEYSGYEVDYIMNLTDVGHLTGDNLGDADTGEDRMEKSAEQEGKSAWEVAQFYTDAFLEDFKKLNLEPPRSFVRATDHIPEQIELIGKLKAKGFTYQTSDGIYFDTSKFPNYGELSNLDQIKEGARVEVNPEKKNSRDFALWKFSPTDHKRQMEWESPWGVGFPGWHIECSAMAMRYLGETLDIHVGGTDLRETHHPNEIAQSEAATGKKFADYWVHSAFMLVKGERMSKSLKNNYRIYDLEEEKFDPLALRYLYLQTHYRQEMNFTFPALEAAGAALSRLREFVTTIDPDQVADARTYTIHAENFLAALNEDLNLPKALGIVWEMMKEDDDLAKAKTLLDFDRILGLDLANSHEYLKRKRAVSVPYEVAQMIEEREVMRKNGEYVKADHMRNRIRKMGFDLKDTKKGTEIIKISAS